MTHHMAREMMAVTDDLPVLLTAERTAKRLDMSRTKVFELIKSGELESVKIGRSRRVPADAITRYVDRLLDAQSGGTAA